MNWSRRIRAYLPQEIPGPMAALYETVATGALGGFYRQVAFEIASLLARGRVLDVGTGPGHLLGEIAERSPGLELVGIDLSRRMLKIAKSVVGVADVAGPDIRLVHGDVQDLPFRDGEFDLVVSTLSLHHWRDPAQGIRECSRVTAPGGRCWIYDLRTDVPSSRHARLLAGKGLRGALLGWIFKFHGVDPKDYEARSVSGWLSGGATVEAEVREAYLKLEVRKAPCRSHERAADFRRVSSDHADGIVGAGPRRSRAYGEAVL